MSAFVVSRKHINYLMQASMSRMLNPGHGNFRWFWNVNRTAGTYESGMLVCNDYRKASIIGQMLWDANIAGVLERYPNDTKETMPGPVGENFLFEFHYNHNISINPIQVLKACDCFEYQASEWSEWDASEQKAIIDSLRSAAWHAIPGYEELEWEL